MELISSAEIAFKLDSVLLDNRTDYSVQIQSVIHGINTMEVLPAALNWTAVDPSVCAVQNGVLKQPVSVLHGCMVL